MMKPKEEPKVHIPVEHNHAVRMSNRQYGELRYMLGAPKGTISLEQVSQLNQTTLGGNKRRGWVVETAAHDGLTITHEGREAIKAFENGDFTRRVASMKFSSFLTLEVYEEAKKREKKRGADGKQAKAAAGRKVTVKQKLTAMRSRRAGA